MTASTEQERAEFEAYIKSTPEWLRGAPWLDRNKDGSYKHANTVFLFGIWQAARRAQVVPQGWKLIPEEVTEEWLTALREKGVRIGSFESLLTDVLAAAPKPPEVAQLDDMDVVYITQPVDLKDAAPVQMPSTAECNTMDCQAGN